MSKLITSGIHRERCDVYGPNGWARVERVQDSDPQRERFTVRFYPKGKETEGGALIAQCWRYGVGGICEGCDHNKHYGSACTVAHCLCKRGAMLRLVWSACPEYDGGWVRALAIAEDYTLGSAEDGYRA